MWSHATIETALAPGREATPWDGFGQPATVASRLRIRRLGVRIPPSGHLRAHLCKRTFKRKPRSAIRCSSRYVAQGGDWGTAISAEMARQTPPGLLGIHVNFPQMMPPDMLLHIRNQDPAPAGLSDAERRAYEQVLFNTIHRGYGVMMGTRPQTVGYLLADTPVGLAAWLLDHDAITYGHLAHLFAGELYGAITRDDVLDNISLYWFTNTATSAARLYWQLAVSGRNFYAAADVSLPAAVTIFPDEYVQAPRSWTQQAYHNLIYFNEAEKGGHFAAWEQPQLFAEELRAAFRTLR
jgi:pimeloyl-ACP methyl ester carboxylesterase